MQNNLSPDSPKNQAFRIMDRMKYRCYAPEKNFSYSSIFNQKNLGR